MNKKIKMEKFIEEGKKHEVWKEGKSHNIGRMLIALVLLLLIILKVFNRWDTSTMSLATLNQSAPQGISVEVLSYNRDQILVKYINETNQEWYYGEYYYLHVYQDGNWYHVPIKDEMRVIKDIGYTLKPNSEKEQSHSIAFYKKLKKGTYRFVNNGVYVEFKVN